MRPDVRVWPWFDKQVAHWLAGLMPPPIPVVLAGYDPEWPRMAADHAERLRVLGPNLMAVHHIGSTSVPGLIAKPIIDLMPLMADLPDLDRERGCLEALGYRWHGELGMAGRRYCTLSDSADIRVVQLHCFKADSTQVRRHIAFRKYLRAHPADSHAYTDAKAAWISLCEAKAGIWFEQWQAAADGSPV